MFHFDGRHLPEKYRPHFVEMLERELLRYRQPSSTIDKCYLLKGKCHVWSFEIRAYFPELKVVEGFYLHWEHFWCVEPDGTIVDMTLPQFFTETCVPENYKILDEENDDICVGKCMNCGWELFGKKSEGPRSYCKPGENDPDQDCEKELDLYYGGLR